MSLVRVEAAVAAIVAGKATVAEVIEAARLARITSWDGFGGWSDEDGRDREPSSEELAAFAAVQKAFRHPESPALTSEQLDRIEAAQHATETEQSGLDKAL